MNITGNHEIMNKRITIYDENVQNDKSEKYGMGVPYFINDALQNENTLKKMIKSPDLLLQNLFKGLKTPFASGKMAEDDILPDLNVSETSINPDSALKLKCKSECGKDDNSTVLLHKRPYEFFRNQNGAKRDNDTASFKSKVQKSGQANFDIQLD